MSVCCAHWFILFNDIDVAEKLPLFFAIIGGETNFSAAYNELVSSKSKTYCQKATL